MNTTTKLVLAATLATAFAFAPTQANAQAFGIGVQVGQPGYFRPVPSLPRAPMPYGFDRRREFERHEAFLREEAWRDRRFHADFDRRHFDDRHRW